MLVAKRCVFGEVRAVFVVVGMLDDGAARFFAFGCRRQPPAQNDNSLRLCEDQIPRFARNDEFSQGIRRMQASARGQIPRFARNDKGGEGDEPKRAARDALV
jgi:hypothetical protein